MASKAYTAKWLPEYFEFISVDNERYMNEQGQFVNGFRAVAHPKEYSIWHGRFVSADGLTEGAAIKNLKVKLEQISVENGASHKES